MSVTYNSHPGQPWRQDQAPQHSVHARLVCYGSDSDDNSPIPLKYRRRAPRSRWEFTREGRAMSAYWQVVCKGELGDPSNHDAGRTTLPERVSRGSREGTAKLLALQRFVAGASFSQYEDPVDRNDEADNQGGLIFLPLELPGWGHFVTKKYFRTKAGLHRFTCKCKLPNPPYLEMWQSAFCDTDDLRYSRTAAYTWFSVHEKRQEVYGTDGFEAPEWDPFPDRRGFVARADSERESTEQRQTREARWSAKRATGRQLPEQVLHPGSWFPACLLPTGPAVQPRSLWTPQQEQDLKMEQEARARRRAVFEAEAKRQQQQGVRRLVVERFGVPVVGEYLVAASKATWVVACPNSGTGGSYSQPVGLSSKTSAETLGMGLMQQGGCEGVIGWSGEPACGEKWYTTPPKEN